MIRVGVLGAAGRMGREVCRAVREADGLALAGVADPAFASRDVARGFAAELAELAGPPGPLGPLDLPEQPGGDDEGPGIGSGPEILVDAGADVVVDFTVAEAARANLPWLGGHGVHAVVGTTGLGQEDLAALERAFEAGHANVLVAPNFAIGAVLLMRLSELAAPFMPSVEIVELHHDAKRDAPSGTALRIAAGIAAARAGAGARELTDATTEVVVEGARGGPGSGGVRVHSVRLPGLVAHHEVIFGEVGQSLTLRHDSYDRRSFMPGVLLAVRRVSELPGLTVGLDALLGI